MRLSFSLSPTSVIPFTSRHCCHVASILMPSTVVVGGDLKPVQWQFSSFSPGNSKPADDCPRPYGLIFFPLRIKPHPRCCATVPLRQSTVAVKRRCGILVESTAYDKYYMVCRGNLTTGENQLNLQLRADRSFYPSHNGNDPGHGQRCQIFMPHYNIT